MGRRAKPLNNGIQGKNQNPQKPAKGLSTITPEQAAEEEYQYYQDVFVPEERGLRGEIRTPQEIEALSRKQNYGIAQMGMRAKDELQRNIGRQGIALAGDQRADINRLFRRGTIGAKAGSMTRTRSGLYDQNLQNMGNFVALGRNLSTTSQDSLADASANQTAIKNTNRQIKAQNEASAVSTLTMLAAFAYFSDRRLKENLIPLYTDTDGINVFQFNYLSDPEKFYIGKLAQDILLVDPENVSTNEDGYYIVTGKYAPREIKDLRINHG